MSADAMLSTWQRKHLNITDRYHLWLDCDKRYNIIVLAWNERGHSVFDTDSVVSVWTEIGMKLYKNQSHVCRALDNYAIIISDVETEPIFFLLNGCAFKHTCA